MGKEPNRGMINRLGEFEDAYQQVAGEVCRNHRVDLDLLESRSRLRNLTAPRRELIRKLWGLGWTLTGIAKRFGDRDHTTVLWYLKQARNEKP